MVIFLIGILLVAYSPTWGSVAYVWFVCISYIIETVNTQNVPVTQNTIIKRDDIPSSIRYREIGVSGLHTLVLVCDNPVDDNLSFKYRSLLWDEIVPKVEKDTNLTIGRIHIYDNSEYTEMKDKDLNVVTLDQNWQPKVTVVKDYKILVKGVCYAI